MHRQMDRQTGGWMDGWMNGWMDGQMDAWVDGGRDRHQQIGGYVNKKITHDQLLKKKYVSDTQVSGL